MKMLLGYNTNGFAHHRLEDALAILAELGYQGVALTPDVNHFDPYAPDQDQQLNHIAGLLQKHRLACVIETGARFLLDSRRKHQPTLLAAEPEQRQRRIDFLQTCIQIARRLGAGCVSFWSGTATEHDAPAALMDRLSSSCQALADDANRYGVRLAFEPEPGMFIDTMDQFAMLHAAVNRPNFGLTLDIGHLVCMRELPVSAQLLQWKDWLWNVHIEDMRAGIHDHVMFGEGDVDFADVFQGLDSAGYAHGVYVELSRHSHDAVNTARKSQTFLKPWIG